MKEESPDGCEAFLPQTPPKVPILLPWYPLNEYEDSGPSTPLRQKLAQEESGANPPVNLMLASKDVAMADTDEPTFKQEESPLATFGVGSLPLSPVTPRSAEKRKASRERAYEPADNKRLANFSDTEESAILDDTFSQSSLSLGMYCPEFTEAEVFCQETSSLFRSIFAESNYKDDESEYLKMRVAELSEIKYPGRLLVGFVGDSGQGKSSLINSIIGLEGLAQEGNGPFSCTHVVQEFVDAVPDQTKNFATQVWLLPPEQCLAFAQDCLDIAWHYIHKYGDMLDHDNHEDDEEDEDDDDINPLRWSHDQAETSLQALVSLFRNTARFADEEVAIQSIQALQSAKDSSILSLFEHSLNDLRQRLGFDGDVLALQGDTIAEISEKLSPYISESEEWADNEIGCSPWPIVRLTRTGIRSSQLLKSGLTLVDLPGLSDVNTRRVEHTRRYMQSLHFTVVVHGMERIASMPSVKDNIRDAYRRHRGPNVILVCTKIDSALSAKALKKPVKDTSGEFDRLGAERLSLGDQLKAVERSLQGATKSTQMRSMISKKKEVKAAIKALEVSQSSIRVKICREEIQSALEKLYASVTGQKALVPPIFCVSNTEFSYHASHVKRAPKLSLQDTGIPPLRNYLNSLPSKGKVSALRFHCLSAIPAYLSSVQMNYSNTKMQYKGNLIEAIGLSKQNTARGIVVLFNALWNKSIDPFLKCAVEQEWKWLRGAGRRVDSWKLWKGVSYLAFIRHDGNHRTKKVGKHEWNAELFRPVADSLDQRYHQLNETCDNLGRDIAALALKHVNALIENIRQEPDHVVRGLEAFLYSLEARKAQLTKVSTSSVKDLKLEINATLEDARKALDRSMATIYNDTMYATLKTRRGICIQRMQIFEAKVRAEDGIFSGLPKVFEGLFRSIVRRHRKLITEKQDAIFEEVKVDILRNFTNGRDDSKEKTQLREKLHAEIARTRVHLDTRITECLNVCQAVDARSFN